MSISVSPVANNRTVLETSDNVAILYHDDVPVAIRVGSYCMAANSSSPSVVGFEPTVVLPQSEIDYIVRTI